MKTFDNEKYLEESTKRINEYVAKLKHGTTFKYVKGLTKEQRTLLNICIFRQRNGDFLKLTNYEMKAFNMEPTNGNGMIFAADVTITSGRPTIVPVAEF